MELESQALYRFFPHTYMVEDEGFIEDKYRISENYDVIKL